MPRPCKIGVQLPEVERRVGWDELFEMARVAERVGFDSLWVGDHLLYDLPGVGWRGPWEAWTSLAALAAVTTRVELGPLVASTGFHHPAMLAKKAATVDAISGGRLIVGLGAGWNETEYRAFGFAFDHRVARFAEALGLIAALLRDGRADLDGEYYRVDGCVLDPPPARPGGPPLMLGSIGPRMLQIAVPLVDAWNAWWADFGNDPERYRRLSARVDDACAVAGRDPAAIERSAAVLVQLPGGAGRTMGDYPADRVDPVRGDPSDMAAALAAFARAGAGHLQLVVDPITAGSIEALGEVLGILDAA